jgi:hypothetical protein
LAENFIRNHLHNLREQIRRATPLMFFEEEYRIRLASIVGCGLLGWGLISISIQGQTFADILKVCSASARTSCTTGETLTLLAVPMLFGFSERALTSFESTIFGKLGQKRSTRR